MNNLELIPEVSASIKEQLTQDFLDNCIKSDRGAALADLVYNKAINNPLVRTPQKISFGQLSTFWVVLTQIGEKVNLGGHWITGGAVKADALGIKSVIDGQYEGTPQITVGEVTEQAIWIP
ncbi:hypothetical protein F7018_04155 [Tenacibaculum aiptasiae]|uniref:Uncharacterized protein n=1 Tax=Tenacibaculum aiptasiae TaxID=426481 RepID=A0A7J5APJ1_9FLAO|nr:hypothetical protein [Tenacibaculum aiptasiae]KAB1159511.1 hypothetical protein F7018_04155 [Tenacibaculum aiptasiae]